jgi:hypothetical protein
MREVTFIERKHIRECDDIFFLLLTCFVDLDDVIQKWIIIAK